MPMNLFRVFICLFLLLEILSELLWAHDVFEHDASPELNPEDCICVHPTSLTYPESHLYQPQKLLFTLTNKLHDDSGDPCKPAKFITVDSDDEQFQIVLDFIASELSPGGQLEINTMFVPRHEGLQHGTFRVKTSLGTIEIDAQGVGLENIYQIAPFVETIPVGISKSWPVTIHNPHPDEMKIMEVYTSLTILIIGESTETENVWLIKSDESVVVVQLSCQANTSDTYEGYVLIKSDLVEIQVPITIQAKQGLEFHPSKVKFNTLTSVAQNRTRIIKLENFYSEPVSILDIRLLEPDDRISLAYDSDLIIPPSSRLEVCRMSFVATDEQGKFDGELLIYTSLTHTWRPSRGLAFNRNLRPIKGSPPQEPVTIPYEGRVFNGSLVYIKDTVLFEVVNDEKIMQPKVVTREVKLRNAFKVPLHVTSVQVSDKLLEVIEFEPIVAQPSENFTLCTIVFRPDCMNLRKTADLRLTTNVTVLHIPLTMHNGGLLVTSPSKGETTSKFSLTRRSDGSGYTPRLGIGDLFLPDPNNPKIRLDDIFDALLDFGNVVMEEKYEHVLEFVNDNPDDIVVREVSTSSEGTSPEMVLATFPRSSGPSYPIVIKPKVREELVVTVRVPLGEETAQSRIVTIETSSQTFRIGVSFTPIAGLVSFEPIEFGSLFPGITANKTLVATSSYRYPVKLNTDVQTRDPRFMISITKTEIPAKSVVDVGYIVYDPSKCGENDNYMNLSMPDMVWEDFASTDKYPTREEYTLMRRSKDIWDRLEAEGETELSEQLPIYFEDNNHTNEVFLDISASLEFPNVLSNDHHPYGVTAVDSERPPQAMFVHVQNPTNGTVFIQLLPLVNEKYIDALANEVDTKELPDPLVSDSPFSVEIAVESSSVVLEPNSTGQIGPVFFKPTTRGKFSTVLYLRNNLTHLSTFKLFGEGGQGGLEIVSNDPGVRVDSRENVLNLLGHTPSGYTFNLDLDFDALGINHPVNGTFSFVSPDTYKFNKTSATMKTSFSIRNSGNLDLTIQNFVLGSVEDVPKGSLAYSSHKQENGCNPSFGSDSSDSASFYSDSGAGSSPTLEPSASFFSSFSTFLSTIFWPPPPKRDGRNLGYGFHVYGCSELPKILRPQDSTEFILEYQPDFLTHQVHTQLLVKTDHEDYNVPVTISIPVGLVPMLLALQPLSEREIFFRRMLASVVMMLITVTWWNVIWECRLYRPESPRNAYSIDVESEQKVVCNGHPASSPIVSTHPVDLSASIDGGAQEAGTDQSNSLVSTTSPRPGAASQAASAESRPSRNIPYLKSTESQSMQNVPYLKRASEDKLPEKASISTAKREAPVPVSVPTTTATTDSSRHKSNSRKQKEKHERKLTRPSKPKRQQQEMNKHKRDETEKVRRRKKEQPKSSPDSKKSDQSAKKSDPPRQQATVHQRSSPRRQVFSTSPHSRSSRKPNPSPRMKPWTLPAPAIRTSPNNERALGRGTVSSLFDSSPHSTEAVSTRPASKSDPLRASPGRPAQRSQPRPSSDSSDHVISRASDQIQPSLQFTGQRSLTPLPKSDKEYAKLRDHAFGPNYESRHQTHSNESSPTKPRAVPAPPVSPVKYSNVAGLQWQQKRNHPKDVGGAIFSNEIAAIGSERASSSRHDGSRLYSQLADDRGSKDGHGTSSLSLGSHFGSHLVQQSTPSTSASSNSSGSINSFDPDLPEALRTGSGDIPYSSYFSFLEPQASLSHNTPLKPSPKPTPTSQAYSPFTFRKLDTDSKHLHQSPSTAAIGSQLPTPVGSQLSSAVGSGRDLNKPTKPSPSQKAVGSTRSPSHAQRQDGFGGFSQLFGPSPLFAGNDLLKSNQNSPRRTPQMPIGRPTRFGSNSHSQSEHATPVIPTQVTPPPATNSSGSGSSGSSGSSSTSTTGWNPTDPAPNHDWAQW